MNARVVGPGGETPMNIPRDRGEVVAEALDELTHRVAELTAVRGPARADIRVIVTEEIAAAVAQLGAATRTDARPRRGRRQVAGLPDPAALMTPQQVAGRLGVSRSAVYSMIRTGQLASVRVGALPRVDPADLRRYLDAGARHVSAVTGGR